MRLKLNQQGFSVLEGLLIIVILGLIGGTGYFVYQANKAANKNYRTSNGVASFAKNKKKTPTNFADCKAAAGSVILQTSPEQCRTTQGKTFTDTTKVAAKIEDKQAIVAAITAYMQKTSEPGADLTNYRYPVDEIILSGVNAKGVLRASVGDPMNYYAQNQNGTWQIIYFGHLPPSDNTTCAKYNLPSTWCGPY